MKKIFVLAKLQIGKILKEDPQKDDPGNFVMLT